MAATPQPFAAAPSTNAPATPLPAGGTSAAPQPSTAPQSMSLRQAPQFALPRTGAVANDARAY
jgi:hypothetical protein